MADAFKLTAEDGKRHVWACGVCGTVQRQESAAASCCSCRKCGTRSIRRHYLLCEACEKQKHNDEAKARHLRELRLIAAATLVDLADYDEDQVSTTPHGEEGSYYLPNDDILDADDEPLAWAWACTTEKLGIGTFDARDLVANATEEWFEDAADNFDIDGLQKLLDGWCESQPQSTCYFADESRIVVLDPARRAEVEAMVEEAKREVADADAPTDMPMPRDWWEVGS